MSTLNVVVGPVGTGPCLGWLSPTHLHVPRRPQLQGRKLRLKAKFGSGLNDSLASSADTKRGQPGVDLGLTGAS